MRVMIRALAVLGLLAAASWVTSCGHFNCTRTFGASTCAAGGGAGSTKSGSGSTGGTGGTASAFIFTGASSGIESFTFSAAGQAIFATPNVTTTTAPSAGGGRSIVVQGKYLYASFYGVGLYSQIYGWTIGSDGSLTAISGSPFTVSNWTGTILTPFATNKSGTMLFEADAGAFQGMSNVHSYLVGSGGVLTEAAGSPVSIPFSPGDTVMDGLGNYLYIVGIAGTGAGVEVGAYTVSSSGVLAAVPGSPFAYPMTQIAGDASGKYLIGTTSSTGDAHLYVFAIQTSGANAGAIAPVAGSPFVTLSSPYSIAVQPAGGELVYSFSLNSSTGSGNPIEGYQLNTSTGALTAVVGSPFTALTGQTGQFDQAGTFLFGLNATTLTAYQVPSSGTITSLASTTQAWLPPTAVTDVP